MNRSFTLACLLLFAALLAAPRAAHAGQSYGNCTGFVTSVPATISTQGTWCLKADLATAITSGAAITIATNNVTLDCNDFKIGGLAAGVGTQAYGVYATNRFNATVRRCNIRGFYVGVNFSASSASGSGGHLIENNRFDGNTYQSINVRGDGSMVRNNRAFDTGGSTVTGSAAGIYTINDVDVLDNAVDGVVATSSSNGSAYGIESDSNINNSVNGNRVRGVIGDGTGVAYAIYNNSSARMALRENDVLGNAAAGSIGLRCVDANASAKDNTINGFATAISLCSDDGGNAVIP